MPDTVEQINSMPSPRRARGEIIDLRTREVWQDLEPCPREWWDEFQLEPPFVKVGFGAGNMDRMWFRRSPGADVDGPVRIRDFAGRTFFHCATAPKEMGEGNPRRMLVDKHHTLVYEAGRAVQILSTPEGKDFVLVVEGSEEAPAPKLPDGWSLRDIRIEADWVVDLPAPTETYWFEGMISYQGPLANLPIGDRRD